MGIITAKIGEPLCLHLRQGAIFYLTNFVGRFDNKVTIFVRLQPSVLSTPLHSVFPLLSNLLFIYV